MNVPMFGLVAILCGVAVAVAEGVLEESPTTKRIATNKVEVQA